MDSPSPAAASSRFAPGVTHEALLRRLLPGEPVSDLPVVQGQFHHVVIGSDRVVRFARTEAAAARLTERAAVLRVLAGLDLGFRTPEPLLAGGTRGTDEPPFLLLSRVPGAPLADGVLDHSDLDHAEVAASVAAQYASLLAALADAGTDTAVRAALPHAREGEWRRLAADVRAELFGLMSDAGRLRAERDIAELDGLPHLTGALVHGDLGGENVLWQVVGGRPRLSGVVDWDEVTLGDPAEDLAAIGVGWGCACGCGCGGELGDRVLDRVLALGGRSEAYAGVAGRAATIRGTFALQQALSAYRDGDEQELAEGLAGYL
ncbi:phosphotransferase family protein [Streptomyces sp. NPDC057302]|uniref:phosphotransferase family protein n=1 Tax=Streptomyces sp. NPDC057302 TaxID=3346094 RepID=UPI003645D70C